MTDHPTEPITTGSEAEAVHWTLRLPTAVSVSTDARPHW